MTTSIFLSLLSVILEDLRRGKWGFGFGMRVMRELCKTMPETVLIGIKLGDRGGGGADVSAPKRRRIGSPSEPKVSATVATIAAADAIVGGSPSRSQFCLGDYWCLHWCAWTDACENSSKTCWIEHLMEKKTLWSEYL
jgi:hypothetical protein